ncbi:MAG: NADP-dependent malic enzyme [Saprospiraceae bacterium]
MDKKEKLRIDSLKYHEQDRPGKIEVVPTKKHSTQRDLSLAYSPGVAEPCLSIAANPDDVYKYTAKGNLVAVISNGTAVLGLGDIGPEASKPVMEGKGLLFKIYADIDVFDIELNTKDVDTFVQTVKLLEPTFGGVNLEDISAPQCFEIEERLIKELKIPVMHDDQHGTAMISAAALMNALEIVEKSISDVKIIVNGAGASAISCTRLYVSLGAQKDNIFMFDSKGLIHPDRTNLDGKKSEFANGRLPSTITLTDAIKDADVFIGLSKGNVLNGTMIQGMAPNPIIFAMANPDPEISYTEATSARPDAIVATGRSDFPNQVNNVLGFPFIFRGALDVRACCINESMKLAAVKALANLAKKPVPDMVNLAYGEKNLSFGKEYIIPKPVDPRLLVTVAPAVALAAMETNVAKQPIDDWEKYKIQLTKRLGLDNGLIRLLEKQAKRSPKKIVFTDAEDLNVLKAVVEVHNEGIAFPVLLGNKESILTIAQQNRINLSGIPILDPSYPNTDEERERIENYSNLLFNKRKRKGFIFQEASAAMVNRNYFGAMMVDTGDADAMISGLSRNYPDALRPALQIIGPRQDVKKVCSMYILMSSFGPIFLADATINFDPSPEELVEIAKLVSEEVISMNIEPRIAFITYSNFGSVTRGPAAQKMRAAVNLFNERYPHIVADGEMQAHLALESSLLKEYHPFSSLSEKGANILIFPNLSSANIAVNLVRTVANIEKLGPVILGMNKPVQVLQLGSTVREIVNMVTLLVVEAQKVKLSK